MCTCDGARSLTILAPTIFIPTSQIRARQSAVRQVVRDREVPVRHAHEGDVAMREGVTGRLYEVHGQACACVDEDDAEVLLESGR